MALDIKLMRTLMRFGLHEEFKELSPPKLVAAMAFELLAARDAAAQYKSDVDRQLEAVAVGDWDIIAQRLNLQQGSVVLVRCKSCTGEEFDVTQAETWANALRPHIGQNGVILFLTQKDASIEVLNEKEMAKHGWVRLQQTKEVGSVGDGSRSAGEERGGPAVQESSGDAERPGDPEAPEDHAGSGQEREDEERPA